MKKFMRALLSRRVFILLNLLLQIAVLYFLTWLSDQKFEIIAIFLRIVSVAAAIYILQSKSRSGYKLIWCIMIFLMPVFGGLFYILFKFQAYGGKLYKRIKQSDIQIPMQLEQNAETYREFAEKLPSQLNQVNYLKNTACFPVYKNTQAFYLSPGEEKFRMMVEELEKAKHFIFVEYFIIEEGYMWDTILKILKRKKDEGLDVRVMYDDMGCLFHLPNKYSREIEKLGIPCVVFNPFRPVWSSDQNNRDHRKILVIDGCIGFTGGVNIADEYINYPKDSTRRHWKDASIAIRGEGVWTLTLLFLQLWNVIRPTDSDYAKYRPEKYLSSPVPDDGFIQPYGDSPVDDEEVIETAYTQMITNARKYIYIITPYLIIDDNLISALSISAKSGVDVRIITPFVPDKKLVLATTRTYYEPLVSNGIKIYEYTPGFIHSKVIIADDTVASVGTANFDYRSFCMSFECGIMLYGSKALVDIKKDFYDILSVSKEITLESTQTNIIKKIFQIILRACAPLL